MILRRPAFPLSVIAALAVSHGAASAHAQSRVTDSVVYHTVLDSLYGKGADLIRSYYVPSRAAQRAAVKASGITPYLAASLERAVAKRRGTPQDVLRGWQDAEWITPKQVVRREPSGQVTIGTAAWLSRIGYSPDSTLAAVYKLTLCGGLCGDENLVVLERLAPNRWRIRTLIRMSSG